MARITILGAGAWGAALAYTYVVGGHTVCVWGRGEGPGGEESPGSRGRGNGFLRHRALVERGGARVVTDAVNAVAHSEIIIVAVPAVAVADVTARVAQALDAGVTVISVAKGFDDRGLTPCEAIEATLTGHNVVVGCISGPTLSAEMLMGHPTAAVVAFEDGSVAARVRDELSGPRFRLYSSADRLGVELGGAFKNVVALGAGMADGLGVGINAKAALVSRGLGEMTDIGVAEGATRETFAGLSGAGDCMATSFGETSRNRRFGELLAGGNLGVDEALTLVTGTVEGIHTLPHMVARAHKVGVDIPVTNAVAAVVQGKATAREALDTLLSRAPRHEWHGAV